MNFPGNFFHIGDVDVTEIRRLVDEIDEARWEEFGLRQRRYEVHQHTQTIGLVYDPDFRHSHPTRLPMLDTFAEALQPVLWMAADHFEDSDQAREHMQQYGRGYFIRASLVRLLAGCGIAEHRDMNFSLAHSHRLHLPVITNDQVWFTVGGESINLQEGQLYEINNRRTHSVRNDGTQHRVHLILDFVLPGEKCCCGHRLHPGTNCSPQACDASVRFEVPCTCFPDA